MGGMVLETGMADILKHTDAKNALEKKEVIANRPYMCEGRPLGDTGVGNQDEHPHFADSYTGWCCLPCPALRKQLAKSYARAPLTCVRVTGTL